MDQQQGDCGCLGGFLYRSRAAVVGVGITVNSSHERLATCSKIRGTSEEVLLYPVSVRALEDDGLVGEARLHACDVVHAEPGRKRGGDD